MASAELQMVLDMLSGVPRFEGDIATRRRNMEMMTTAMPPPPDITYEGATVGGVAAEWALPPEQDARRVVLYFHGGGYCIGSIATHRNLVGALARATRSRVLSVDYRLGPEHRFPAAVEDAVAAYRGLLELGIAPQRIAIAGDSAGGGLTMATLIALRDQQAPMPGAAIGISAWLDLTHSGESIVSKAEADPMLRKSDLELFASDYLGTIDPKTPTASPLFADLSGLPPLLLHVGTAEVLLDDTLRFAERARAAGVETSVDVYDDMVHVWHAFEMFLPEGKDAIERIGDFVKRL